MKKKRICYVIADGGRARLVERDGAGTYRTVSSFVSSDLHKSTHELGRDRPARVQDSAGPSRHAVQPRRDLHEAAKEGFIHTLAAELATLCTDDRYDALVLVAPPGALTVLRGALDKPSSALVLDELQKDLTKVPDHDLAAHLSPE
jgi:protein required for attachment to host cells